ncbi:hypothetical protein LR066_02880 [candidate division WOR-3 bacterium]|nr:hypothetical protein [candidate division WOR-3 bacterium]
MEFLLLGGMILLMGLTDKVKAFKSANKALIGLKIPIGIVVFLVGVVLLTTGGIYIQSISRARLVFPGLMGMIAGVFLIIDLFKLIPQAQESIDRVTNGINAFQIPIGIITIIAAITGMFQ